MPLNYISSLENSCYPNFISAVRRLKKGWKWFSKIYLNCMHFYAEHIRQFTSRSFQMKTKSFFFLIKISKYFIFFITISSLSKRILPGLSVSWLINLKRLRFKRFKDTCTWHVHLKWTFLSCYNSICFHQNKHFGDTDNTSRDVILDWMQ